MGANNRMVFIFICCAPPEFEKHLGKRPRVLIGDRPAWICFYTTPKSKVTSKHGDGRSVFRTGLSWHTEVICGLCVSNRGTRDTGQSILNAHPDDHFTAY